MIQPLQIFMAIFWLTILIDKCSKIFSLNIKVISLKLRSFLLNNISFGDYIYLTFRSL